MGATSLAAGYTAALAALDTETTKEPLPLQDPHSHGGDTVVVPVGQISEWVLDDIQDETSDIHS